MERGDRRGGLGGRDPGDILLSGTSVSWIGYRGPVAGIAHVFLDGVLVADVDTYSPVEEIQGVVYAASGLTNAAHTLTIEVTGLKNASSVYTTIIVDAFEVISP